MAATYTKKPYSLAEFTMMRGTIDFSNPEQFNFFESGYSFLVVLSRPHFIEVLGSEKAQGARNDTALELLNLFCFIIENEFRGLSGIEDITTENLTFNDGINELNTLGKTIEQSGSELTMSFTERSGAALTRFIEYYLKGCKASRTQAKTYHGLIKLGILAGGFEYEVFNLLYLVTDNTLLGLEKAYLLVNAWPTKAQTSIYESEKGSIEMKQIDIPWQAFVLNGETVNQRALRMLAYISESNAVKNYYTGVGSGFRVGREDADSIGEYLSGVPASDHPVHPDSNNYEYQGFSLIEPENYQQLENAQYSNGVSGENTTTR